jgi:transposase
MKMFVGAADVYLHRDPVDFRKQINGLTAIVELEMKQSLNTGVLFFFAASAATN